ncbi:MAG TPA: SDR family oxidoreductase [Streptosporangiaceae bacterium]|jgi:NAD(P)-dependent dehydrogenase (short-subunit alcohol dehydrogenase family)|nr:SDR family oxidoreductase [Streptosporangiaceae bacterium]
MNDLAGRAFLVTGGNTGIGLATARGLAARGGRVHIACRSRAKGQAAVAAIAAATGNDQVGLLPLDLADLASVRACAAAFLALGEPLHVLVNNAGVGGSRGLTADGFERAFGTNHLGHFALTTALLDRLAASAPARVVTVASDAHYQAKGVDFGALRQRTRSLTGLPEYAVSKLCNVLFSAELARRVEGRGITCYALHPGLVGSDIFRRVPQPFRALIKLRMLTTEQGAQTSLYCATDPGLAGVTGRFYDRCAERLPSPVATVELGRRLWEQSEAWAAV